MFSFIGSILWALCKQTCEKLVAGRGRWRVRIGIGMENWTGHNSLQDGKEEQS